MPHNENGQVLNIYHLDISCVRKTRRSYPISLQRQYKVYRYEGPVNRIKKTVVLLSYPTSVFGDPSALCTFPSGNQAFLAANLPGTVFRRNG